MSRWPAQLPLSPICTRLPSATPSRRLVLRRRKPTPAAFDQGRERWDRLLPRIRRHLDPRRERLKACCPTTLRQSRATLWSSFLSSSRERSATTCSRTSGSRWAATSLARTSPTSRCRYASSASHIPDRMPPASCPSSSRFAEHLRYQLRPFQQRSSSHFTACFLPNPIRIRSLCASLPCQAQQLRSTSTPDFQTSRLST